MELSHEIKVESWTSSKNQNEIHFFMEDGTYLFGFNPKLMSRSKVAEFLCSLGFKANAEDWADS
jgi:hypothetical protein